MPHPKLEKAFCVVPVGVEEHRLLFWTQHPLRFFERPCLVLAAAPAGHPRGGGERGGLCPWCVFRRKGVGCSLSPS